MTLSPFVFEGYDIISPILRILKDEKLMFPKENLLLAVKILGRFFAFHKKKEEYAIARKKERNKLASLEATLVRNYDLITDRGKV